MHRIELVVGDSALRGSDPPKFSIGNSQLIIQFWAIVP